MSNDGWNGEPVGYAVTWRALGGDERETGVSVVRGAASCALVLDGLPPGSRFEVAVRAFTHAGLGPPTPFVSATTLDTGMYGLGVGVNWASFDAVICVGPDEAPRDVRCEATSAGELHVRWAPPRRALSHLSYDVIYAHIDFSTDLGKNSPRRSRDNDYTY